MKNLEHQLKMKEDSAAGERDIKKQGLDLEKELLSDPVQQKLKKMQTIERIY